MGVESVGGMNDVQQMLRLHYGVYALCSDTYTRARDLRSMVFNRALGMGKLDSIGGKNGRTETK